MLGRSGRRGRPAHPDVLTPAEWRVLEHLREGRTNAEIAVRLGISPDGVKFHVSNMLAKLGLADRQALAGWDGVEGRVARPGRRSRVATLWGSLLGAGAVKATVAVAVVVVAGAGLATAVVLISGESDAGAIPDAHATLKVTSFELTMRSSANVHLSSVPGASPSPSESELHQLYANGADREEERQADSDVVSFTLRTPDGFRAWTEVAGQPAGPAWKFPTQNVAGAFAVTGTGYPSGATTLRELLDATAPGATARLMGNETVAGRAVYRVEIGPTPCPTGEPDFDGPLTIWVDKDTLFVLKSESRSLMGGRVTGSYEVTSIAYNPIIDTNLFQPPPDVAFSDPTSSQSGSTWAFSLIESTPVGCPIPATGRRTVQSNIAIGQGTIQHVIEATASAVATVRSP